MVSSLTPMTTYRVNAAVIAVMTLLLLSVISIGQLNAAETVSTANKPVLIESKVTGTQEQPKVLYIMPWQGITNPVAIQDNNMQIILPQFKPINPKKFQQEVRDFSVNTSSKQ
ncbi:hypothetical protein BCU94_04765 [Shewanella sp. 10N.286.52.C2]|uniref:Uncharacterized protein n=1 Tax=Shewanella electrodiphila TaxID=934143 RepID=A0ABT0KIY3_9GAMM|nr:MULTISPECIES: hypothetical protein [Shewanella]MCL1043801.1 hypothetical protein [Shewanella electrodiphila]MDO6619127.1 hypothetical protein [Shewanella sp. 6_MG-2023]MDO6641369.1 hypothetical protein [Shewanella sp. 5_MG-2023]MDO6677306.1 hypothetical protein [Shewanella sp. 4_MG-2023]MDO6773966.1 hypothetical protein [Shewanella sp. 3_MG-2023]